MSSIVQRCVIVLKGGNIETVILENRKINLQVVVIDRDLPVEVVDYSEETTNIAEYDGESFEASDVEVEFDSEDVVDQAFHRLGIAYPQQPKDEGLPQNNYRVSWQIDVTASTPELAAVKAEELMPAGDITSYARTFNVINTVTTVETAVDLGITLEDLEKHFGPIIYKNDEDEMFERDEIQNLDVTRLWTVVEGDSGGMWVQSGYHFVNRIGYLLTTKPWVTGTEEYIWAI